MCHSRGKLWAFKALVIEFPVSSLCYKPVHQGVSSQLLLLSCHACLPAITFLAMMVVNEPSETGSSKKKIFLL